MFRYTPRQLKAFLLIKNRRDKREAAAQLAVGVLASRGDKAEVKKAAKKWSKGDD